MKAWVASAMAAATLLAGCGGAGTTRPGAASAGDTDEESGVPNTRVTKVGSDSVTALVGPPGGSLELSGGPRVESPSGAVEEAQEYVLSHAPKTTAFGNYEHERAVGPTFVLSPAIEAPEGSSITVSLPLAGMPDGWGDPSIAYEYVVGDMVGAEDAKHTRWDYESARLSGGRLVADLPGLPGERLQFVLTNLEAQ